MGLIEGNIMSSLIDILICGAHGTNGTPGQNAPNGANGTNGKNGSGHFNHKKASNGCLKRNRYW